MKFGFHKFQLPKLRHIKFAPRAVPTPDTERLFRNLRLFPTENKGGWLQGGYFHTLYFIYALGPKTSVSY
jgi:hypothetical protein